MRMLHFLWCMACLGGLLPQGGLVFAGTLQRQTFTTDDGLPQNSVHAVLQTRDGFLWAATEGGVVRFDGIRFMRFTTENERAFTSNDACCLSQTADGTLWIGTSDGIVRLHAGHFDHVVAGPVLAMLAEPQGTVLALTATGLERSNGSQMQPVALPSNLEATAIGPAGNGSALVAAGTVLLRAQNGSFVSAGNLPAPAVELFQDAANRLWLRSSSAIWMLSAAGSRQWRTGADLPGTRIFSLSQSGSAVLAGTNQGAYVLHADRAAAELIPAMQGTSVLTATADTEGDLWLGTDTSGLAVLRSRDVEGIPALNADTVTSVAQGSDGTLWIGTRDSGLKQLRNGSVIVPANTAMLASQTVLALAPDVTGGVWIGTPQGLYHLHSGQLSHETSSDGLPDDFVNSLLADETGVWVGTRHGAAHWAGARVDRLLTTADGLPSDIIGAIFQTHDRSLWIGTLHGLVRLQGGLLQAIDTGHASSAEAVTALAEAPGGELIFGSRSGTLGIFTAGKLRTFRTGSIHEAVDAILLDGLGNLWIRTPTGVSRAALTPFVQCPQAHCNLQARRYGIADGMPSIDASSDGQPSAWRGTGDVLWFATRRGVARIDAAHLAIDKDPPHIVIEQVQVDDTAMDASTTLKLGPGHRRLVINYAGLSFRAPSQVLYRFKLQGFDRDWVDTGNRRFAEYTNLPPGHYRFLVEARNADGISSANPAEVDLRIASPLYRRPWFYALLVGLAAALVYGFYRLRLRRIQRDFSVVLNERNRIAREIHDTLAQDFVAVSLQLEVTSQLLKVSATEAAQQQIDATRLLVRDGIRDARESIWALRADQSAAGLPARLHAVVNGAPNQSLSVTGAYRAFAPSLEKELLRIAKEAIGNAAHHAQAHSISVDLLYSEDAVVLTVRDDGAGFNVASGMARAGHYGLRGMHERAVAMGATLTLTSAPGQGTTVSLHLDA